MSDNVSYGAFHNPSLNPRTEKYLSIREYDLSELPSVLSDIPEDCIVTKITLIIDTPFDSDSTLQLVSDTDEILFDMTWNDPTTIGAYCTDLNYHAARGEGELCANTNLIGEGSGTLRIELYQTNNAYYQFLTSDGQIFTTADGMQLEVITKEG